MWISNYKSKQSLNYRKKYKCPICKDYSLYVFNDRICECENGCDTDGLLIEKIFRTDEFKGHYTSTELKKNFYLDEDDFNKLMDKVVVNNTLEYFITTEKEKVFELFNHSYKIDSMLDDIVVRYMNKHSIEKIEVVTPFGYLINLIEDMHHYVNLCLKDMILFDFGLEFSMTHFYSGRFFYMNAVEHLFYAYERSFVILGIIFGYHFDNNLENNKTFKIEKYIKKQEHYVNNGFKDIYINLKGNSQLFKELENMRKYNDHDISYHSKIIIEETEHEKSKWNVDGDVADKLLFLPKVKNMIYSLNEFYTLIEKVIEEVEYGDYEYESNPMLEQFLEQKYIVNAIKLTKEDFNRMDDTKNTWFLNLYRIGKEPLLVDIFFRFTEILHCVADLFNMANDTFYKSWDPYMNLRGLIDEEYLVHSALFRVYACYDKLAKYLSKRNECLKGVMYFKDFEKIDSKSEIYLRIKKIIDSDSYKNLDRLRNDLHHNLRPGCLYGEDGKQYSNFIILQTIFENLSLLIEFINYIFMGHRGLGRNDECNCGSGLKYKKCCLEKVTQFA